MKQISIIATFTLLFALTGCNQKENTRKITDEKVYTVTVASKKLPGLLQSCGNDIVMDMYAVKKEGSQQWESLSSIQGFDYVEGYEYKLRIRKTSYLDYSMGEPAWTEYALKEILSKEKKTSEGLPESLVPAWMKKD